MIKYYIQVNEQRTLIGAIEARKLQLLGHKLWHDISIQVAFNGVTLGKKGKRLSRANLIIQICGKLGLKYTDIKRRQRGIMKSYRKAIPVGRLKTGKRRMKSTRIKIM